MASRLRRDADLAGSSPSSISRRLPETERFQRQHVVSPPIDRRRFAVLAAVAVLGNLFVAPASLFQNGYLEDERGYSAALIAAFTLATATPAGHRADRRRAYRRRSRPAPGDRRLCPGRRRPARASPSRSAVRRCGWRRSVGIRRSDRLPGPRRLSQRAVPDRQPQHGVGTDHRRRPARRHRRAGGDGGVARRRSQPRDRARAVWRQPSSHVVAIVLLWFPETAHRELEDLNPIDRPAQPSGLVS